MGKSTGLSLWVVVLGAYLLQIATPIYAVIYSMPSWDKGIKVKEVEYKITALPQEKVEHEHDDLHNPIEYRTIYNRTQTNHGAVLRLLSTLSRLEAVLFQDINYVD